ncbi:hypothetical protein HY745_05945 [Candidatus Desantisbacteria bacterium]|nr:hypothetical protein [Candidatus Desantisbacteria bacterium]
MEYNSEIHNRKSIRLKEYDYSSNGAYFITICTHNHECLFEKFISLKNIVINQLNNVPERFPDIILDAFVIMPNHLHGIFFVGAINNGQSCVGALNKGHNVGAGLAPALNIERAGARPAPTNTMATATIGKIIGQYKSLCVNEWLQYIKKNNIDASGKFWQRNYYEHIIRNEQSLNKIREYIINNPLKWDLDEYNPVHRTPAHNVL